MTDDHQDDTRLIAVLDKVRGEQRVIEHFRNLDEAGGWWIKGPGWPDIGDDLKPIIEVLKSHPKFMNESTRCFASKQLWLNSQSQAYNLLKIAVERGPSAAVAWYHKIYSTKRANLRYVSVVYGLHIAQQRTLSNGVSLMPLAKLPPSANAREVQLQFQSTQPDPTIPWPIGATFKVPEVVCSEESSSHIPQLYSNEIEETIRAFTLVEDAPPFVLGIPSTFPPRGAAPVIGTSWIDFIDPDLAMAEVAQISSIPDHEGSLEFFPRDVNADAIEWVERYFKLAPEVKPQCDIAIGRLNLARRRHSPGNKAIEGGICLEALLGDQQDQNGITYKLALRSALLLSSELIKRENIRKAVKKFYKLRSRTVHGGTSTSNADDEACAANGLDICAEALRKIVSLNTKINFMDLELSGREPQLKD